jgi:hypothetical protein
MYLATLLLEILAQCGEDMVLDVLAMMLETQSVNLMMFLLLLPKLPNVQLN